MQILTIKINGRSISGPAEPRTLLVEFLRGNGLTGTHVGCDTSQCGACTVLVEGRQIKSCTMLAVEAEGSPVTTIEGMAEPDGTLSRMQRAFRKYHGLQCGFCTPGMIVSATALLRNNPSPSEAEIRHHLEGNICRCTGYHNIVRAIQAAADPADTLDMAEEPAHV